MNRYQIYLEPKTVDVFDRIASDLDWSRSEVFRDIFTRIARGYAKVSTTVGSYGLKNNPLHKMIGIGKSSTGKIARDVDSIYSRH